LSGKSCEVAVPRKTVEVPVLRMLSALEFSGVEEKTVMVPDEGTATVAQVTAISLVTIALAV
jgi:hypothetical protein